MGADESEADVTIDYDRAAIERATFADREAAQLDCVRPTLRRWRMTEAGEDIGEARAFSRDAAIYSVTLLRRRDSLPTTAIDAREAAPNGRYEKKIVNPLESV